MADFPAPRPPSGSVAVDGAKLSYVVEGHGRPCLVVGSSAYYRRTFSQPLKDVLRCAFLDHRGFLPNATTGTQEQYTLDMVTDDVEQVRRALSWDRVVVYGHSIHGLIALEYARRHPEHVSHVVMEGSSPFMSEEFATVREEHWTATASEERKALMEERLQGLEERLRALAPRDALVAHYVAFGPRLWADPRFDSAPLWEGVAVNSALTDQLFAMFAGYDAAKRQPPVAAPIFAVNGWYDYQAPFTTWQQRAGQLGDLTCVLFEQSGHTPHFEEPERFAHDLARWLQQH